VSLDVVTMEQAVQQTLQMLEAKGHRAGTIVTVNAQFVYIASKDRRFCNLLQTADLVLADGMSVVAASRLLGHPIPERIAGVDLVVELCRESAQKAFSVYFLGGRAGTASETATRLSTRFPKLKVAGVDCPPIGFEFDGETSKAVERRICEASPDLLFVGLGAPKQEYWMEEHAATLPVKAMIGVGGSFELLSGRVPRAPLWIQRSGLEWAFRLYLEPNRLWKRYLFSNLHFIWKVLGQTGMQACEGNRKGKEGGI
jgi:N-acetylglucosaminyldiphosphoundecaprenol N-acetyl-beta-D-mannosaminyltransferase